MILSGTHTITVSTANTYGVTQVTLYIDNVIVDTLVWLNTKLTLGTDGITYKASDMKTSWAFTLDTTKYSGTIASPATHTLKAIAYDLGGNASTQTTTITIGN